MSSTTRSSSIGVGIGIARDDEAVLQQCCSIKLMDLAIGLLTCPLSPQVLTQGSATEDGSSSSLSSCPGVPCILTANADVQGAANLMTLVGKSAV